MENEQREAAQRQTLAREKDAAGNPDGRTHEGDGGRRQSKNACGTGKYQPQRTKEMHVRQLLDLVSLECQAAGLRQSRQPRVKTL